MNTKKTYPPLFYQLAFIGFLFVTGMGLVNAFIPILALELDPSKSLVGVVVSAWFFSRIFMEIPSGMISDRIGRRKPFIGGILLGAMGSLMCAMSSSIYVLILGRTLWGFGAGFFFLNNTALITDLLDPKIRMKGVGVFQGVQFTGFLVGTPIGAFLSVYMGYQNVFYLAFGLMVLSWLLAPLLKDLRNIGDQPLDVASSQNIIGSLKGLWNWGIIIICVACFVRMFIASGVTSTVLQIYFNQQLKFDVGVIGIVLGMRMVGFIVGTLVSGNISERISIKNTVMMGFGILCVCLYLFTTVASLTFILPLSLFSGLGTGLVSSSLTVWLTESVKPESRGISIGLYRTFLSIGGLTGPIFFVFIEKAWGIYSPFLVAAIATIFSIILTTTVKQSTRT